MSENEATGSPAQEHPRQIEVDLAAVFDALPAMAAYWSLDMRNLLANRRYVEYFGLTPSEMLGRHAREIFGEELFELNRPYFEAAATGEAQVFEREFLDPEGRSRLTQASFVPHHVDGELKGVIVLVADITPRAEAERALASSEEELRTSRKQLQEAERIAEIGSWEWDIERDRTSWSPGMFDIYGLSPAEFDPSLGGAERRVYPPDRALVADALQRALRERSGFSLEYRAVRADGRVRTLRNRAEVVVDDEGRPVRVVGVARDVTESTLAREALADVSADLERRAEQLRRQAAGAGGSDQAAPPVTLTDRQREIVGLIADGLTNDAIAERLVLAPATVKWHVKQLLAKTGAANRAEVVAKLHAPEA